MKIIAMDVGSTTVKAVAVANGQVLWRDYKRHNTKQAETVLEFLARMESECGVEPQRDRIFITGSGAGLIGPYIGAKFVQEVVAVAAAVEKLHPGVRFVSEIGGEDMKTVFFTPTGVSAEKAPLNPALKRIIPIQSVTGTKSACDKLDRKEEDGKKRSVTVTSGANGSSKQVYMQSACSGGTGTFIEKTARKLEIATERLAAMDYDGLSLHKISSKCGIFAEADANTLVKSGVPVDEIIASLFEAVVYQNLATLTKGNTPQPEVLLLGGPNMFFAGLQQAWRHHLKKLWEERSVPIPDGRDADSLILIPPDALYYACLGCVEVGKAEAPHIAVYEGSARLRQWIEVGQHEQKAKEGSKGLVSGAGDLQQFLLKYGRTEQKPAKPAAADVSDRVFIGCDFGSTTAKAVVLSRNNDLLFHCYVQSRGNPIEDAKAILRQIQSAGYTQIDGMAITGYGKDLLKDIIGADLGLVETVAHATAALHFFPDADVICDVGGCDVKIMLLRQGTVSDFRLNSQCSSGNGAFLQGVAERYDIPLEQYADKAFQARAIPTLAMGCGVFLQSDIVNQQRKGWSAEEIMASLAAVLPLNVWIYAGQLQNLPAAGKKFILQGGTHRNLAVVKAQVDFINNKVPGAEIVVHPYPGEAGAIGAALCARDWAQGDQPARFRGFAAIEALEYRSTTNEHTTCHWCPVNCRRTFIDVVLPGAAGRSWSKLPLEPGWERVISGNSCPKGLLEDVNEMRVVKAQLEEVKRDYPNIAETLRKDAFRPQRGKSPAADRDPKGAEHLVDPPVLAGDPGGTGN